MIAIVGGLGAALCWSASTLCASAASRSIGAASALAWVMGIGLALVVVPVVLLAPLHQLTARTTTLLAVGGLGNVLGLEVEYVALRRGKVGVVAAIASAEGVIAAAISVLAGARLGAVTAVALVGASLGVALAAWRSEPPGQAGRGLSGALLAIPTAMLFGVSLYATGRAGSEISVLWVLVPARLFGALLFTAPLAVRGRLRLTRSALPLVAAGGAAEVGGFLSYALGARHGLAVSAVLSAQFAALAAVGGLLFFAERLSPRQLAGLVVIAASVGALAATR